MTDFSFDIDLWMAWREFNFWSITILGFLSALIAYISYDFDHKKSTVLLSILVMSALVVLLGLFPIEWGYSTDRANYASIFVDMQNGSSSFIDQDYGFSLFSSFLSRFIDVKMYFVVICVIYLSNYLITVIKLVGNKSYWLVAAVILSMAFTNYAVNTIRAGLALSFIVLSLSQYPNKWKMLCCIIIGSAIHRSAAIPSTMIIISYFYPNTKLFFKLWFLSIPVSFVAGSYFMELFAGMSDDTRTSYLTDIAQSSYNIGFRIDFIIYSLAPIIIGWYYIFKCEFKDSRYTLIYNSYILTNIFWILVIRSNYSDRFAYLSWFFIPFVLVYPLLKQRLPIKENMWLGMILLGETAFKFFF